VPARARAQQRERIRRVGVLTHSTDTEPLTTLTTKLLRDELQKLGWIEGRNLQLDFRFGFGDTTRTRVSNRALCLAHWRVVPKTIRPPGGHLGD
jgi:putative ABC transport system substrate-binding protein